jgi:hypothetical protein
MSAAVALTPRVRIMAICDDARERKIESGVYNLKGVRQSREADSLPFASEELCLFLLLSSARAGRFPGYIRIVNDRNEKAVFHSNLNPTPVFAADGDPFAAVAPIRCVFPEAGHYTVQLWFFQEDANDVLKGEMPFSITREGA